MEQEQGYTARISTGIDGTISGQLFYNGRYISGSTVVSKDREQVVRSMEQYRDWHKVNVNGEELIQL
jgi:hypothetical protein